MKLIGAFEIRDVDLWGRIGRLYVKRGYLETPAFFPVIDISRQEVGMDDIIRAGFNQVITNAYLIYKRYGWGYAAEKKVHGILGFNGIVMTDSGAYQILEYGSVDIDPQTIVRFQQELDSDISVILDVPTGDVGRREAQLTVKETLKRAIESSKLIESDERVWVLPIQGGRHLDLVEFSAREAASIKGYSMFGIGSPTVFMEKYLYDIVIKIVYTAKRNLPPGKPIHLFGAGHPLIFPYAVALGVDTFDSASYILYARSGRYMVEWGVYRIEELDYFPCSCPVCSRYTPQELREMVEEERVRLIALHNLYVISRSIKRVKQAIREGRLWELLEETSRMHPAATRAFKLVSRWSKNLSHGVWRGRGRIKGVRAFGVESLSNPKLTLFKAQAKAVFKDMLGRFSFKRVVFKPMVLKPDPGTCESFAAPEDTALLLYAPYVGVFPLELCGVYPSLQVDYPGVDEPREVIESLAEDLHAIVMETLRYSGVEVVVEVCSGVKWSEEAAKLLGERGLESKAKFIYRKECENAVEHIYK